MLKINVLEKKFNETKAQFDQLLAEYQEEKTRRSEIYNYLKKQVIKLMECDQFLALEKQLFLKNRKQDIEEIQNLVFVIYIGIKIPIIVKGTKSIAFKPPQRIRG